MSFNQTNKKTISKVHKIYRVSTEDSNTQIFKAILKIQAWAILLKILGPFNKNSIQKIEIKRF